MGEAIQQHIDVCQEKNSIYCVLFAEIESSQFSPEGDIYLLDLTTCMGYDLLESLITDGYCDFGM